MNRLTKQEQLVLCIVLGLLLTGIAVKAFRTAHPRSSFEAPAQTASGGAAPAEQAEQ